jgi:UDP-N-acetylbacillosamine N-acetyltransferase
MPSLVIWGASGHARVVADIVRLRGEHDIAGFLDDTDGAAGRTFLGAPVLGGRDRLASLRGKGVTHVLLGFGDGAARLRLAPLVRDAGLAFATAVHPSAVVAADVAVGDGTVIAAGAVVNPATSLGEHVIVNTRASVDHDCAIGRGAHVAPGATLGGWVRVGEAAWVGLGASVRDRVRIGSGAVVGAGAVVVHDVPDDVVAYGVPARVIRRTE